MASAHVIISADPAMRSRSIPIDRHSFGCVSRPRTYRRAASQLRNQFRKPQLVVMATPSDGAPWTLWYWPGIKGRGEYIRLVLEEAGVPYVEPAREGGRKDYQVVVDWVWGGGNKGFPARAVPALERGGFAVSNTPAINGYLGHKYGLHGNTLEDAAHVDQLLALVSDIVQEGRLAFHPQNFYSSHKGQEEASVPFIKQYGEERLPKHMKYFDSVLAQATPGPADERYLVANKLTVADLVVYHFLAAAEQHFKEYYAAVDAPLSKAFQGRIASRPRIAAYLASERCQPWDTDSMM